ncbi:hypothetical protein [Streptomyces hydrogenans]|uniref:hypothetical protein n=1 Tax=Streptomyces hydrogenans TaxID=1873719 RepID=UPI0035E10EC9
MLANALARTPDGLDLFDAAPFGSAGMTTYNAVRKAGVSPSGRIAVFGIGGLGHLPLQFAAKLGYETIATASSGDRPRAQGVSTRRPPLPSAVTGSTARKTAMPHTSQAMDPVLGLPGFA